MKRKFKGGDLAVINEKAHGLSLQTGMQVVRTVIHGETCVVLEDAPHCVNAYRVMLAKDGIEGYVDEAYLDELER